MAAHSDFPEPTAPRYGCHEARQDVDLVMGGRAFPSVRAAYEGHLRDCRECRRMHRVLLSVYDDPRQHLVPRSEPSREREFQAVLQRYRKDGAPRSWAAPATVARFATPALGFAAALALWLRPPSGEALELSARSAPAPNVVSDGGIEHPAQSFGRVVAGEGAVSAADGHRSQGPTFSPGSRLRVGLTESLQVLLAGKVAASLTPGTEATWAEGSPRGLVVELERGLVAIRYDRRPEDPVLTVRTPTSVVRVVGTVFTVQVDSDRNTVVSVLHGKVEVVDAARDRVIAEVEAGYRFDASNSTFGDVGRAEVLAALPLSNLDGEHLADGLLPSDWVVPGLPEDPALRRVALVPTRPTTTHETTLRGSVAQPRGRRSETMRQDQDEGEALIDNLVRDARRARRAEVRSHLERCGNLYDDPSNRYLAARCLAAFVSKYGEHPDAVEAYLLVGMLRMDYALDYTAADTAFREFLRRAPEHDRRETAYYRLWLSATEDGRIGAALDRGREYLAMYPDGRYVGRILQRYPELKSAL